MRSTAVIITTLVAMVACQPHDLMDTNAPPAPASMGPTGMGTMTNAAGTSGGPDKTTMAPPATTGVSMMTDTMPTVTSAQAGQVDNATDAGTMMTTGATTGPAMVNTTALPASTTPASLESFYPDIDEIIQVFKDLARSEYFRKLSYEDQILVLELASGGEAGKITEVMDSIGYERLYNFIYKIPLKYFDTLMQFILAGIDRENNMNAAS